MLGNNHFTCQTLHVSLLNGLVLLQLDYYQTNSVESSVSDLGNDTGIV